MAIKDVILGYAKGEKGDQGPQGAKGETGATGPKGDPGNIADAQITDTEGLDVAKGQKTTAQKLFDAIANRIVTKLVTNDTLTKKLADYMLKGMMSNTNVNNTGTVPTSALMYSMFEQINNNLAQTKNNIDYKTAEECMNGIFDLVTSGPDNTFRVKMVNCGFEKNENVSGNLYGGLFLILTYRNGNYASIIALSYWGHRAVNVGCIENGTWIKRFESAILKSDLTQQLYIADSQNGICEIRWPFASNPNNYYFLRSVPNEKRTYYGYNEGSGDHIYYYLSGTAL